MLARLGVGGRRARRAAARLRAVPRRYSAAPEAQPAGDCTCAATVNEYGCHIFLRPGPTPVGDRSASASWPPIVERSPGFVEAFSAIAQHRNDIDGVVKVTAYDTPAALQDEVLPDGKCDIMLFPAGVMYSKLSFSKIKHVVEQHVAEPTDKNNNTYKAPPPDSTVEAHQQEHEGISLFVCCHASRDERCGTLGPQLVEGLMEKVEQAGLAGKVHVYECSHVGGHKYAGNVLVFGEVSPCHGDWFGNVRPRDAKRFLDAVVSVPLFSNKGGAENGPLRTWWRGRMGMSKEDQRRLAAGEDLEEGDDSGEDSSEDSDEFSSLSSSSESESEDDADVPRLGKGSACNDSDQQGMLWHTGRSVNPESRGRQIYLRHVSKGTGLKSDNGAG